MKILNKSNFLRVANYSALIWALSVIGLIGVVSAATNLMTHDPSFSLGDPEYIYLLPMLSFLFVGLAAFVLMVSSGITGFMKKELVIYKAPLGLSTKRICWLVGILLFGVVSFFFGFRQALVPANNAFYNAPKYTGQEVFDAINKHRVSKGLNVLMLDPYICDNLVQRYLDITNPDNTYVGHAGFERWAETEGLTNDYVLVEVYVSGSPSAEDAVKYWEGSPGHRLALEGNYEIGCAYASEGISVAVFGRKK